MYDIGRVKSFEGTESLVDEVLCGTRSTISGADRQDVSVVAHLAMIISELLCPDDTVQVGLHELLDDCATW